MFEVGQYVIYGNNGVCKVEAIGKMEVPGMQVSRQYYTLLPVYVGGSKVYTPIDNTKVVMRAILSKEEVQELIHEIPKIELLWVPDERGREQVYKETLKSCDCKELIRIIKTLYLRKQSRLESGKKITTLDERYLHLAEELLYGEWAIPLEMDKSQVESYITDEVHKLEIQDEPYTH